jgi:hypothetical protein
MKYNHENRRFITESEFIAMCRDARDRAAGQSEEDLLWSLLERMREDLGSDDPGGGILPFGSTRREVLLNNIFHHFNHQYNWSLDMNISGIINRELLHKQ